MSMYLATMLELLNNLKASGWVCFFQLIDREKLKSTKASRSQVFLTLRGNVVQVPPKKLAEEIIMRRLQN